MRGGWGVKSVQDMHNFFTFSAQYMNLVVYMDLCVGKCTLCALNEDSDQSAHAPCI